MGAYDARAGKGATRPPARELIRHRVDDVPPAATRWSRNSGAPTAASAARPRRRPRRRRTSSTSSQQHWNAASSSSVKSLPDIVVQGGHIIKATELFCTNWDKDKENNKQLDLIPPLMPCEYAAIDKYVLDEKRVNKLKQKYRDDINNHQYKNGVLSLNKLLRNKSKNFILINY